MKTPPLTPQEAERVFDLVAEAGALEPEQRAAFLAQACVGADGLRAEVESLLGFKTRQPASWRVPRLTEGWNCSVSARATTSSRATRWATTASFPCWAAAAWARCTWRTTRCMAGQVALKLIGQGRAEDVRGRHFRHERKVLATLNHPHIARLYGSGVTAKGQAYLVMEYVEGERLDRYCQDRGWMSARTARALSQGVRGGELRAPEPGGPPRPQAGQHPRHARGRAQAARTSASPSSSTRKARRPGWTRR